ncbi:MAG TPA: thioredoxin family protein [Thermoanaerobaculia bacterium]
MKIPMRPVNALLVASTLLALLPSDLSAKRLEWQTDWAAAFEQARAEQKPVFVNFYAEWCGPCRAMRRTTLIDPRVTEQLERFVLLAVDVGSPRSLEKHGLPGVPYYSIRDPWERDVVSFLGYHEARSFGPQVAAVADARSAIIDTGLILRSGDSAQAWRQRAAIAQSAGQEASARHCYLKAAAAAAAAQDPNLESVMKIEAALTLVRGDRTLIGAGMRELEAMLDSYTSPEVLAATWLAIGFAEEHRRRPKAAREAYAHGLELAPKGTPLADQLTAKLEGLGKRKK